MNRDIFIFDELTGDLNTFESDVAKAGNILAVQIGDLEYQSSFGIDKKYFVKSEFQFQNESFKAYLVDRLLQNQINVANVIETINTFSQNYSFEIGFPVETGGLIS